METPQSTQPRKVGSLAMIRRLPNYLRLFRELQQRGGERVSSASIAGALSLTAIQVRKDIEAIGVAGRARLGYDVVELVTGVEELLGWNNTTDAFLGEPGTWDRR